MQRMSNMLTRLLEGRMGQDRNASTSEQASGEEPSSQDPLESTELYSGESSAGTDGDIPTSGSSLSGSDGGSLTTFVSFSTSERGESGDDSKESYEMSEDRSCSLQEGEDRSQEDLSFQTSWLKTDDQSNESNAAGESEDKETITQEAGSSLSSGNQEPTETTVTDATSSSSSDILNGVSFGGEPADVLESNQSCNTSHVSGADVAAGTVSVLDSAEEVAKLTASDSVDQGGRVDLLCNDLSQKSVVKTRLPKEMDSSCEQLDNESTGQADSAGNLLEKGDQPSQQIAESSLESSLENVGGSGGASTSSETCEATAAAYQQLTDDVSWDSEGRVVQLGEKVKSLADSFADVLVTEQASELKAGHPDLESNDRVTHQQGEGLATALPDAGTLESQTSVIESPMPNNSPSTVTPNSQVFPLKSNPATSTDDLNNQPSLDRRKGK